VVAVVATTPETVQDDIARAMDLAGAAQLLPTGNRTLLKVNISWQHWYPGCSSTPWQIEGVANALKAMGYADLIAAHNGTVVVDSYEGEENNKHKAAQDKVGLPSIHLDSPPNRWIDYKPRAEMLALTRYRLQSRPVTQKNGALRIGGVGTVTYRALGGDRYWLATMQMLAEFARYSGVGVQTATGMGQARRLQND